MCSGLLCNDVVKVIKNFLWFHSLRYTDNRTFSLLSGDFSPFPKYGIFTGNMLYLLSIIESTTIRQRWDDHHSSHPDKHQKLTACLLMMVGQLIDTLLLWARSTDEFHYYNVTHPRDRSRRDIYIITDRLSSDNGSLKTTLQQWRTRVQDFFTNLEDVSNNAHRYTFGTSINPILLDQRPTPPFRPGPRGERDRDRDRERDRDRKRRKLDNDPDPGKSDIRTQHPALISYKDKSSGKKFNDHLKAEKFQIDGKAFCFSAVGASKHGCRTKPGKACDRIHLNLDDDASKTAWNKEKLKLLWDFCHTDKSQKLINVTPAFKTFYESLN